MNKLFLQVLCGVICLTFAGLCQAVDIKIYSVADGESDRNRRYADGTSRVMWADDPAIVFSSARRSVIKFPTASLSAYTLRGAVLNLYGGRSSSYGSPTVKAYHYAYDGWSDASIPYASSVGNLLDSQQITYSGYNRAKYTFLIGNNLPYDNDGYLSIALIASGGNAWFNTRNTVTWDGSKGHEPYINFRTWGPTKTINGQFSSAMTASDWSINSGGGTASVMASPHEEGNSVASLITGSPIEITQFLDTPQDAFYIVFDYEFLTETGVLDVTLTNRDGDQWLVGQLTAEAPLAGKMSFAAFHVDNPDWLYLDNVKLGLELNGPTGSQILLDNVTFSDVPEPASLALIGLGCMGLIRRRRK